MAAEVAGRIENLALSPLAAEVVADQISCSLHGVRHQPRKTNNQRQKRLAETEEVPAAAWRKLVVTAVQMSGLMQQQILH